MGIIFFNNLLEKFHRDHVAPFSQLPPKIFVPHFLRVYTPTVYNPMKGLTP